MSDAYTKPPASFVHCPNVALQIALVANGRAAAKNQHHPREFESLENRTIQDIDNPQLCRAALSYASSHPLDGWTKTD